MQVFNGLVIAAFLQGFIMSLVICFGAARFQAKVLGWILFLLALLNVKILLHTTGLWQTWFFHYFPLAIDTTLPALFIFYARAVTGEPVNRKQTLLTLIPTIIFLSHALVVYAGALLQPGVLEANAFANKLLYNQVKTIEDLVAILYSVFSWLYCFRLIVRYRRWLFLTQSNSSLKENTWLRNLLIISAILILGLVLVVVMEDFIARSHQHFVHLFLFYMYLAVLTWYLSLKGFVLYREVPQPIVNPVVDDIQNKPGDEDGEDILAVKVRVISAMEQGYLYLDPELTLKAVATYTGDPVPLVSAAINQVIGKNFRTFINEYRVAAVKKRLQNPPPHLSLLGVAIECGFNSEASFYRIFRQFEGMSPNEYLQKQK
jgi:AraC-like DNA-binding protein